MKLKKCPVCGKRNTCVVVNDVIVCDIVKNGSKWVAGLAIFAGLCFVVSIIFWVFS